MHNLIPVCSSMKGSDHSCQVFANHPVFPVWTVISGEAGRSQCEGLWGGVTNILTVKFISSLFLNALARLVRLMALRLWHTGVLPFTPASIIGAQFFRDISLCLITNCRSFSTSFPLSSQAIYFYSYFKYDYDICNKENLYWKVLLNPTKWL